MKETWFTITPENAITAFATEQEARDSECRFAFADRASLEVILSENEGLADTILKEMAGAEPDVWTGISTKKAAKLIWDGIQGLASAVHVRAKTARVRAQGALAAAKAPKLGKKAPAKKGAPKGKASKPAKPKKERAPKTKPSGAGPFRADSKAAQLVEMLRQEPATLPQIMKKFGWLAHTTRALLSAGGSLAKKGIVVLSEKADGGDRTYRITS